MLKKTIAALAALVLPLIAVVAITASPANAATEASALTGSLELWSEPNFAGTRVLTVNPAQGTCIKPNFAPTGQPADPFIESARVTGAGATLVVDLMTGENCGGTAFPVRIAAGDSAPVVPTGTFRSALVLAA